MSKFYCPPCHADIKPENMMEEAQDRLQSFQIRHLTPLDPEALARKMQLLADYMRDSEALRKKYAATIMSPWIDPPPAANDAVPVVEPQAPRRRSPRWVDNKVIVSRGRGAKLFIPVREPMAPNRSYDVLGFSAGSIGDATERAQPRQILSHCARCGIGKFFEPGITKCAECMQNGISEKEAKLRAWREAQAENAERERAERERLRVERQEQEKRALQHRAANLDARKRRALLNARKARALYRRAMRMLGRLEE